MAVKGGRGKSKRRNSGKRQRKSIILFAAEGNNKTETLYFTNFNSEKTQIKFTHGNETDPVRLMQRLLDEANDMELGTEPGDRAYCLIDNDVNPLKDDQIARSDALSKGTIATQIVSNPCFEIWYLCHYRYSTRQYLTSAEVIAALQAIEPTYTKEKTDMYQLTIPQIMNAYENAIHLEKYNKENGNKLHTSNFQPSTEVHKVIKHLLENNT